MKGFVAYTSLRIAWLRSCGADKLCSGHAAAIQGQHEEGHRHGAYVNAATVDGNPVLVYVTFLRLLSNSAICILTDTPCCPCCRLLEGLV